MAKVKENRDDVIESKDDKIKSINKDDEIIPNISSTETTTFDDLSKSFSEALDTVFVSDYISEFEHISCLGKGTFGVVFRAKKKFEECEYAVKRIRLPNNLNAKQRVMREVQVLAKLDHENILSYYDFWSECPPFGWQQDYDKKLLRDDSMSYTDTSDCTQSASKVGSSIAIKSDHSNQCDSNDSSSIVLEKNSQDLNSLSTNINAINTNNRVNASAPIYLYIQMELCLKESLKDWLRNNTNRNNKNSIVDTFKQVVEAVRYIHLQNFIHRDLKPSNILFSLEGQVKVADFGLAMVLNGYEEESEVEGSDRESYTKEVDTHLYMSPEQVNCQPYDNKVDIYSLGIILFEMLVPFQNEKERIKILKDLRNRVYPQDFGEFLYNYNTKIDMVKYKYNELIKCMLSIEPKKRPIPSEILRILSEICFCLDFF